MEWPNLSGNQNQQSVTSLLSEMVIDEQVRQYRKRTLYKEIDEALEMKNKERFLYLTSELRELIAYDITETG